MWTFHHTGPLVTCLLSSLNDIGGQCLFKERFFFFFSFFFCSEPQRQFLLHGHDWTFLLFPEWDLTQKVALGHLTSDWNNELADRNCHIPCSIAPIPVRAVFLCHVRPEEMRTEKLWNIIGHSCSKLNSRLLYLFA